MAKKNIYLNYKFGQIKSAGELGQSIRAFRKYHRLTLERVSGLSGVSMRFLSELERGKESAHLGKTLEVLSKLGLDIIIKPRDYTLQADQSLEFQDENND